MGRLNLQDELSDFKEWGSELLHEFKSGRHDLNNLAKHLTKSKAIYRAVPTDGVITFANTAKKSFADTDRYFKDIIIQANPANNASGVRIGGITQDSIAGSGYLLLPGASFTMSIPTFPEFSKSFISLADLFATPSSATDTLAYLGLRYDAVQTT